jgi:hypothetical protein
MAPSPTFALPEAAAALLLELAVPLELLDPELEVEFIGPVSLVSRRSQEARVVLLQTEGGIAPLSPGLAVRKRVATLTGREEGGWVKLLLVKYLLSVSQPSLLWNPRRFGLYSTYKVSRDPREVRAGI